jgi:hypothetical protein
VSTDIGQVSFTLQAVDEASSVLEGVQTNLQDMEASVETSGASMQGMGAVATSAALNTQALSDATDEASVSFTDTSRSAAMAASGMFSLANMALVAERAHTMLDRAQLTVQKDTEAVAKAQEAYNKIMAETGPNSTAAAEAAKKLSEAQKTLGTDTKAAETASLHSPKPNLQSRPK